MDDLLTSYVNMYLRDNRALQTKNQRFNMWAVAAHGAVHTQKWNRKMCLFLDKPPTLFMLLEKILVDLFP